MPSRNNGGRRPARRARPAPARTVSVRMYRHLLGDCFLLGFPAASGGTVRVLVDCGVLQGFPNAGDRMRRVAEDIKETTGGHLDLLIVTHEHWDHLSGFSQARDIFKQITVGELWFAWTEDDKDELAQKLRAGRRNAFAVLQGLQERFAAAAASSVAGVDAAPEDAEDAEEAGADRSRSFVGLLDFYDEPLGAAGRLTTAEIVKDLKERTGAEKVRYWRPGVDPFPLPGTDDVRVFVLGPPVDEAKIRKSDPSKRNKEVYVLAGDGDELRAALADAVPDDEALENPTSRARLSLPFDPRHMRKPEALQAADLEARDPKERDLARLRQRYLEGPEWRRADHDWLGAAEQLALKLDGDTNNTSLALAFALGDSGRVMLFPGDAQVGNWLSWDDLAWPVGALRNDPGRLTIRDLLARTVLYKVGHHASHNATLRDKGLELMTSDELVALIPVNERFARDVKGWDMPYPKLYEKLVEKTRGRILRADRGKTDIPEQPPAGADPDTWPAFRDRVTCDAGDDLYVEYAIAY